MVVGVPFTGSLETLAQFCWQHWRTNWAELCLQRRPEKFTPYTAHLSLLTSCRKHLALMVILYVHHTHWHSLSKSHFWDTMSLRKSRFRDTTTRVCFSSPFPMQLLTLFGFIFNFSILAVPRSGQLADRTICDVSGPALSCWFCQHSPAQLSSKKNQQQLSPAQKNNLATQLRLSPA